MKVAVEAEKAGTLPGAQEIGGKEWVARPERSSVAAIRFIVWVALRRRDLLHGYRYPGWLLVIGALAWIVSVFIAVRGFIPMVEMITGA